MITTLNNLQIDAKNIAEFVKIQGNYPVAQAALSNLSQTDTKLYKTVVRQFSKANVVDIEEGQTTVAAFAQEVGLQYDNATQLFASRPDSLSSTVDATSTLTVEELEEQSMHVFMSQVEEAFTNGTYNSGTVANAQGKFVRKTVGLVNHPSTNVINHADGLGDPQSVSMALLWNMSKEVAKSMGGMLPANKGYAYFVNVELFYAINALNQNPVPSTDETGAIVTSVLVPGGQRILVKLAPYLANDKIVLAPESEIKAKFIPVFGSVIKEKTYEEQLFSAPFTEFKAELGSNFGAEKLFALAINVKA